MSRIKKLSLLILIIWVSTTAFAQKSEDIDQKYLKLFFKNVRWSCSEDAIKPKESTLLFFSLHIDSAANLTKVESWNDPMWCNFKDIKQAFHTIDQAWFKYHAGQVVIIPIAILFMGDSDFGNPVKSYFSSDRLRFALSSKGVLVDFIHVTYFKNSIVN